MVAAAVERMNQDDNNRGPGRPPLADDEPTVKLYVRVPAGLKSRLQQVADEYDVKLAEAVRAMLIGIVEMPDDLRKDFVSSHLVDQ